MTEENSQPYVPLFQAPDIPVFTPPSEPEVESPQEKKQDQQKARNSKRGVRAKRGKTKNEPQREKIEITAESVQDLDEEPSNEKPQEEPAQTKKKRKRRKGNSDMELVSEDGDESTVVKVRTARKSSGNNGVATVSGSTRMEAKRQRRRDVREQGKANAALIEQEIKARKEDVDRRMVVRQKDDRIQIAIVEDEILVEHFVSHTQQDSLIGNIYLGKVQNVLPSMEAAFVDIGRGRNAVLYAGEVDWAAAGAEGKNKRIEKALKPGDSVLVQVSKDPINHKGARLTSMVSLPGRYLVYIPQGSMTGISRKLPEEERARLKRILKENLPDSSGVIVRTAAEGVSDEELIHDINRLKTQWDQIQEKANAGATKAPELLYAEPNLSIKVIRDVFNTDFNELIVSGEGAWDNIEAYVMYVAPDLMPRLTKWTEDEDIFAAMRLSDQINKALDSKVFLPSGGSLEIDRTEAMTVIDVNTGKFTGSGGNLEETVTKNNLEAAEEIVRQLRLRDVGGIIVVDFIDMVLESNRDLVLRRLIECMTRDRAKHQISEVTSLGLVQMTRKRMGTGLLEIFSEPCSHCAGTGHIIYPEPVEYRANAGNFYESRKNFSQNLDKKNNRKDSGRKNKQRQKQKPLNQELEKPNETSEIELEELEKAVDDKAHEAEKKSNASSRSKKKRARQKQKKNRNQSENVSSDETSENESDKETVVFEAEPKDQTPVKEAPVRAPKKRIEKPETTVVHEDDDVVIFGLED